MLKIDIWNLLFTIINLLVLFIAMKFFLFKPVKKVLDARQEEADRRFKEAAEQQQAADDMKAQYEKSMADVEQEKKRVLLDARKSAEVEYQRILSDARNTADQVKKDAEADAQNRKAQILKKAETEIADMVVDAAAKVVGEKKGAEIDNALYNKFLDKAGEKS